MSKADGPAGGAHDAVVERVSFRGHPMVRALHRNTIEITTEGHLTPDGDCIIGVLADKGCAELREETKAALRREGAKVRVTIEVGGERFVVDAKGAGGLPLTHRADMVLRRSDFVSDRTLAVGATASARDIPRPMVARLRSAETVGTLVLEVS